jgi:hypothetical protein
VRSPDEMSTKHAFRINAHNGEIIIAQGKVGLAY